MGKQPRIVDEVTLQAIYGKRDTSLKGRVVQSLRLVDEQQFLQRFKWYNLPEGLNANLMERILYYRGRAMLFYASETDSFYFLPFVEIGSPDCYGRYHKVRPLPFTGTSKIDEERDLKATTGTWLELIEREPIYEQQLEVDPEIDWDKYCVIFYDYSKQISNHIIPRQAIDDQVIDLEADMMCYMKTALMNSTGVSGMRVNGADELNNVLLASKAVENAALSQQKWIPIAGAIDFQDLTSGDVAKSEEFLLAMSSIDNFRKMGLGLGNGQLFEKKEHMLQQELQVGQSDSVLIDALENRQSACNLAMSIWPIPVWCELSESSTDQDDNADGVVGSSSEDDRDSIDQTSKEVANDTV